ncbi:hypothetical protein G7078_02370 [Sphingomonas sinipercae]|uniref:Polyhydroxyalkanoic acid system protein n=1 Tax=Sphingomonas sinipercae TaxID=2714944 RepID=A0A6G7ZLE4_9SPHN|nr:polyhydroxyalkanoic acid system family protein [Sphingomonas sinipercae]QIL01745.1 hypothetical protein G7078_02370 [Sphingomonas sinipercae]
MSQPIEVDLPHSLGKDEARRRIGANIHKLESHIPGGANVESAWAGDKLNLSITAMGQAVRAELTILEAKVHVRMDLPGMLGLFAAPIAAALKAKGGDLLLDDKSKR